MSLTWMAAALALAAAAPALADSASPAPQTAPSASAADSPVAKDKTDLLNLIEAWRSTQLPHVVPPAAVTVRFEPHLNEIEAETREALTAPELAAARKTFESWKTDLLREECDVARAEGLMHGSCVQYSAEQAGQAEFSMNLRTAVAQQAAARRSTLATEQRAAADAIQNPVLFFDGARSWRGSLAEGPADVSEPAPAGANDPSRYAKVRQILISQGASPRIVDLAIAEAIRQHADPLLVLSVINQESGFQVNATSYKRDRSGRYIYGSDGQRIPIARGLMQLTADKGHDLYDVATNLRLGIAYLNKLFRRFAGRTMEFAVAAYNAGPGKVDEYSGVPPYRETQGYVKNVLGYYSHLKRYLLA